MNMFKCMAISIVAAMGLIFCSTVSAQQKPGDAEAEKKMDEFIQKQVEHFETTLKLESWQTFYVDSIMNHDFRAMQDELNSLSSSKVSNADIYIMTQDKWNDQMYGSFKKVLNDAQWEKYLKMGAARDKKSRDKRKAKSEGK